MMNRIKFEKVKLLICGLSESEVYLEDLINQLGLKDGVIMAGSRKDIVGLLQIVEDEGGYLVDASL